MKFLTLKEAIADHGDHLAKKALVRIEALEAALRERAGDEFTDTYLKHLDIWGRA